MILFESIRCFKEDFGLIEKLISLTSKAKVGALLLRNLNPLVNKVNFFESLGEIEAMVWPFKWNLTTMISHDTFRSVLQHFT